MFRHNHRAQHCHNLLNTTLRLTQHKGGRIPSDDGSIIERMTEYFNRYYTAFDNEDLMELFDFEARHWQEFDPNETEYCLQHTQLHERYCAMFEQKVEAFIEQNGLEVAAFYGLLRDELEARAQAKASESKSGQAGAEQLIALIEKSTDFQKWAASMRQACQQQREMEDVD